LRRVGTDDFNVQLLHGSSKLAQIALRAHRRLIDPEDAVFVAIEGYGLAMPGEIDRGGLGITEKALALHELQMHQAASGIIDEYQQGANRCSSFKPSMR